MNEGRKEVRVPGVASFVVRKLQVGPECSRKEGVGSQRLRENPLVHPGHDHTGSVVQRHFQPTEKLHCVIFRIGGDGQLRTGELCQKNRQRLRCLHLGIETARKGGQAGGGTLDGIQGINDLTDAGLAPVQRAPSVDSHQNLQDLRHPIRYGPVSVKDVQAQGLVQVLDEGPGPPGILVFTG